MSLLPRTLRLVGGVGLLALTGCYSYSPYGYGPYGGYPGGYGAPPPGGVIQQGPVLGPPSTFTPQGSAAPTWQQSTGPVPGGTNSSKSGSVPEYNDPGSFNSTGSDSPFGSRDGSARSSAAELARTVVGRPQLVSHEPHLRPIPVQTATSGAAQTVSAARQPNPYDHDREGFAWLRGVVDFDEEEGTWNIIYDLRPAEDDELGGSVTLIADDRFQALRNQDVVLVEGHLDASVRDRLGKPSYRVERLARLVAKSS